MRGAPTKFAHVLKHESFIFQPKIISLLPTYKMFPPKAFPNQILYGIGLRLKVQEFIKSDSSVIFLQYLQFNLVNVVPLDLKTCELEG